MNAAATIITGTRDPEAIRWVVFFGKHSAAGEEFVGTAAVIEGLARLKQNPFGANACDWYGTGKTFDTPEQILAFVGEIAAPADGRDD